MRPVARPPWNPRWAGLDAADAASAAFGEYCSACEIPLQYRRIAWNAGTGEVVTEKARPQDWADLLVLCPHCARAATGQARMANTLRPDRDATFALGAGAPFGYEPRAVEMAGTDGGDPDVTERVFVVPNGAAAAETVRLFGLNTAQLLDKRLGAALRADPGELPLSGQRRRQLIELDDPRLMLRTAAWQRAKNAAVRYQRLTGDAARVTWAHLLADTISSRGFWSVWAAVLTEVDPPLIAAALGLARGAVSPGTPTRWLVTEAARDFPATRFDWLTPPSDTMKQE